MAILCSLVPFVRPLLPPLREWDPRLLIAVELLGWSGFALWTAWQGGMNRPVSESPGGLLGWSLLALLSTVLPPSLVVPILLGLFLAGLVLLSMDFPWQWDGSIPHTWWLWFRAQLGPWLGWHLPAQHTASARPRLTMPNIVHDIRQGWRRLGRSQREAESNVEPERIEIETGHGLPPLSLLEQEDITSVTATDVHKRARLIRETLTGFGVPVRIVEINQGPAVTQFCVQPLSVKKGGKVRRVPVKRIVALQNDLALMLAAAPIRIEAPVPGKPYVGIEVPNPEIDIVRLGSILTSPAFQRVRSPLAMALGRDVTGNPVIADLTKLPHLLIAGATGSGKSVAISTMLVTWLMRNTPHDLRLLLIDPKRVELTGFSGVPHLLGPVVTDVEDVLRALTWVTVQMDDRYRLFARARVRNITAYNKWVQRQHKPPLPYMVIVIDELADIMLATKGQAEHMLARLAQMARATGIHLVVATQRPSVDVITGLIKANFPARLAFAVTSQIDSRVILDNPGAETLLGRGDALFQPPDRPNPIRLQGSYIDDEEIERVVAWWKEREPLPKLARVPWADIQLDEEPDLMEQAIQLVKKQDRISASFLQRKLGIGFKRAQQLMTELETMGVVGPDEGGGRGRAVLISNGKQRT